MFRLFDSAAGSMVDAYGPSATSFTMYNCGPTVYDFPHIGHGRAMLTFDLLRRYLEFKGLRVTHVSNITDIDDKILARASEQGVTPREIATTFEGHWWAASDALGALRPHHSPRATDWVPQMRELIDDLVGVGVAYVSDDGVYLEVSKVDGYGLLARQDLNELRAGARVEVATFKRSSLDFALWKFSSDSSSFDYHLGSGRPGWHTECVVMSLGLLGEGFDLHGGGFDLQFPHHENERAQAVALGKVFAKHWMHHGFVEVGGEKMSKSLHNFTTLSDLVSQVDPRSYRLLVARSHYRSPLEVTTALTDEATTTLRRLDRLSERVASALGAIPDGDELSPDEGVVASFSKAMDDDLNTPVALAGLFEAVTQANAHFDRRETLQGIAKGKAVLSGLSALGLVSGAVESIPPEISELARRRALAKLERDYAGADELRRQIVALGYVVEDGGESYRIRKMER